MGLWLSKRFYQSFPSMEAVGKVITIDIGNENLMFLYHLGSPIYRIISFWLAIKLPHISKQYCLY